MAKKTIIDLRNTKNIVAPDSNYVRLKTNPDNSLQVIYSDGRTRTITHAWELPVESISVNDPLTITPNSWDRYIIPTLPTPIGDWSGHEEEIATWNSIDGIWEFTIPEQGWGAYNKAENQIYTFNGLKWRKLTASLMTVETTYDELRDLVRANALVPGNLYKITDYQSYNKISRSIDDIHISDTSEFLCEAVSNHELKSSIVDLDNINDIVIYDISMTAKGWFYVRVDSDGVTINDGDNSFEEEYIWDYNNAPYFSIQFNSATEVFLGEETIIDPNQVFIIGDNDAYTNITIASGDASWDPYTGILTLHNGKNFTINSNEYYLSLNGKFATKELRKGRVLSRNDLVNNIVCDFDWRAHQYALFNASIDMYNSGNSWYCSPDTYHVTIQNPRLDQGWGNTNRDVLSNIDTNDYILKPFLTGSAKNLKVNTSRYIMLDDVNIDGVTFTNIIGAYMLRPYMRNSIFKELSSSVTLPGCMITNSTFTRISTSVLYGTISDSTLYIDRCLIRAIGRTNLDLAHIAMNGTSRMLEVSGNIRTIQMNDTTNLEMSELNMGNVIFQNNTSISYSDISGPGLFLRAMFDNTTISNSTITNRNAEVTKHVYFESLTISELHWTGYMQGADGAGNQVYFPLVDTSNIKGEMVEEAFPGMEIHNNTIYHNAGFTLPPININIDADVSASSMTLELPSEPYNGLIYTFTDVIGNAAINNITISISSSPAVGITNIINGGINKIIDINYGVLIIKYTDVGGWIIIQESVVQIEPTKVDDTTIEYIPSLGNLAETSSEADLYADTWYDGPPLALNQTGISSACSISNGTVYSRSKLIMVCTTDPANPAPAVNNTPILPFGDYYVYATIDLVPYNFRLIEDTRYPGYRSISATSEPVNGIYRHHFHVGVADFRLSRLETEFTPSESFFSRMVRRNGYPTSDVMLTSVNIGNIVGNDGFTFGSLTKKAVDANHELASRAYIDNTKNNADNVTIESNIDINNIITSTENDVLLLMNDAFGHGIGTQDWAFRGPTPANTTLINGEIRLNLADDGSGFCVAYDDMMIDSSAIGSADNNETWNLHVYSNYKNPVDPYYGIILNSNGYQAPAEITTLPDGNYLYRFVVFQGHSDIFRGFRFKLPASTIPIADQPWFRMVSYDDYPPKNVIKIKEIEHIIDDDNESIDGSNTPSLDPHHELPTLARHNADTLVDDITIERSAIPPYEFSNGMDITELVQNNWFDNIDNWGTGGVIGTTYADPVLTLAVGEDTILDSFDATYNVWEAGTYRFYSDVDLVADGQVAFWADNLGSGIYFTSSWDAVESKFLHEAILTGTEEIYGVYCDNAITATANIYLVNRYTYTGIIEDPSITIKGIRHIIDDDYESIDGSNTPMSNAHRELVTRAFFNANVQIIPVTYLELKTMYDAGTMAAGAFYRIADYQHNNWLDPDYSGINTSPNHPIVVYASKNDSLSWIALDDNYKDDTIIYHIDDKADVSIGLSSFGPHVDDNSTGESYVGYPNVVDSLQDDYHWEIGTAFEITGPIQIKINGSIPLGATNTWDPVTGVITSSEDLVSGRNWNIQLIADVKYKDPTKAKGRIIYRKDNNRNIVGNIDWRLTKYNRWAIDSSVLPTVFTDVVILASNSSVDVGQFHDGTSLSLIPKGPSIIQPMLREHSSNANISFRNCEYVVLNDDSDMTDIELQNVSNFTIPEEGGIGKVSVYNAINYFPIKGFSFIQHKSNSVSNGVLFPANTANCSFDNKIEQQTFPSLTNWNITGIIRNIGFASIMSNNVTINSGQYWADCTYGGYFENNNITAGRISSTDITGDFRGNNVVMGGLFQQANCAGDFSYNNINCSEFWDVTTTDFNNNIITATMRYVNLGDVNDTEIKNPIIGLIATHITELDNISFNAISSNGAKVLTKLPLTYALDSTGGAFNLELPPNPTENLTLTFLDVQGNCAIDNVIVDVSTAPDAGIVNTINGNTSYSIGTNYAFFQIRYNTTGGWVIMTESQSTISPDDITIEKNGSNLFTVKGIDFIIDDDNESIDGSDTPMSDAHKELVTRAFFNTKVLTTTTTITLTATDISNKYIDLGVPLSDISSFIVHFAPPQADGIDYAIDAINTRITWNGLGLDGELSTNDKVTIKYK